MKKIFTILNIIFQLSLLAQTGHPSIEFYEGKSILPDAMNRIKVINDISDRITEDVILLDTFPNFNGFPKHMQGSSFEGGLLINLDTDQDFEILYNIGYSVYAWNADGTDIPGWPVSLTQPAQGGPAFGDIDGDGEKEIVVTTIFGTSSGKIYAFEKDGSNVIGFPVNHGYSTRTPVLADLDGNGSMEIIVNKRMYPTGEEWVYSGDGTVYPGWPQPMGTVPASSAAVGDITGDQYPEIVMEAYAAIYAWDKEGNPLPGFPFTLPGNDVTSYSSPVLVDVDGDNIREIIFGTHENAGNYGGHVFILKNDGTVFPNFPKTTSQWIYGPPAVGYIDSDNILDITVGDQVLSGVPMDYVYAWNVNGDVLSGFPIGPLNAINNQITLADIDGDNMQELIFDDNGQPLYHGYNHDGSIMSGWPISLAGETTFFEMPALGDIDKNGVLDILCAANEGFGSNAFVNVNLLNTGITFTPDKITLACFQYNERHNGVYGDLASTIPVELTSFTAFVQGNSVLLEWSTVSELNNLGFEIQRKYFTSNFYTIGFVPGNGTTTDKNLYQFADKELLPGNYQYRLKQVDFNGTFEYSEIIETVVNTPAEYRLYQNYPNPFNPVTKIKFTVPGNVSLSKTKNHITLKVYDVLGNEIATLVNEELEPGEYEVKFKPESGIRHAASGTYFYQLRAGNNIKTKKMILMK